jgi:hypothetical protein
VSILSGFLAVAQHDLPPVEPEKVGFSLEKLQNLDDFLQRMLDEETEIGSNIDMKNGMGERLIELVDLIKRSPRYTTEIGVRVGIEEANDSRIEMDIKRELSERLVAAWSEEQHGLYVELSSKHDGH